MSPGKRKKAAPNGDDVVRYLFSLPRSQVVLFYFSVIIKSNGDDVVFALFSTPSATLNKRDILFIFQL